MKDIPKNYKEMIDNDIRACENYLTTSCTYSRSRELFSELIAKYSVRIDGFGDGLSGYSSKSNSYNIGYPDLEELKENITLIKWKLFSFKQNEYQNSGCTERTPEIAIILYTECDIGRTKEKEESANQYRARQNVVFEHGLFVGCLGRKNVCDLVKGLFTSVMW